VLIETPTDALETAVIQTKTAPDEGSPWSRIYADLFDEQKAAVDDPSDRQCWEKGRRAGGSHLAGSYLLKDYHRWAGHTSLFIALTKEHAKAILWPTLELLNAKYQLGGVPNGLDLSWRCPMPGGRPGWYTTMLKGA